MSSDTKLFSASGKREEGREGVTAISRPDAVVRNAADASDGSVSDHPSPTPHQHDDIAIRVANLSKCYHIYDRPEDRLKQAIVPRLQRLLGRQPKSYCREFWALKDVSFEVKKGESVAVIGRNGSGKSTLLQAICGTLAPTGGAVETHGRIAALLELGSGFSPEFTGRENVYMNGAVLGLSKEEIDARFDEVAAFAGIGRFIEQPVKTYSSGMMVRLAFAVAVCVEPEILVVDEALAVGDGAFQLKCLDRLRQLTGRGTTLLFVSHDMGMVKNFCHRALYLEQGRQKAEGTPQDLAELYFLDIRDEQRRWAGGNPGGVSPKPFLGRKNGIAFGTEEGRLVKASFTNSGGHFSSYVGGEDVELEVEAKYLDSVPHPYMSVFVQDRKLMEVGGGFFALNGTAVGGGWKAARLVVSFKANLVAGRYHITLRLENRQSSAVAEPLEKQVGLLSFEVVRAETTFLGVADLGFRAVAQTEGADP